MQDKEPYRQLLGLQRPWFVDRVQPDMAEAWVANMADASLAAHVGVACRCLETYDDGFVDSAPVGSFPGGSAVGRGRIPLRARRPVGRRPASRCWRRRDRGWVALTASPPPPEGSTEPRSGDGSPPLPDGARRAGRSGARRAAELLQVA